MKALSIRQPWAELIFQGIKRAEIRSWSTRHRGPLLVCAAKRLDRVPACDDVEDQAALEQRGVAVGVVDVVGIVRAEDGERMRAIYEPRGAAQEYAPLAVNLYRGCSHGCRYCYASACLRMRREDFARPAPRVGVLDALEKDAAKLDAGAGPVLLCFTCDPYQPLEAQCLITRLALTILERAGARIRILTKGAELAMRDLDLFAEYDVEVGVTLAWLGDKRRAEWEPHASTVAQRLELLRAAKGRGCRTWVSVEPVIDANEALGMLRRVAPDGVVDRWALGKLNHQRRLEARVDWARYLGRAREILEGQNVYIKRDLRLATEEET